MPVSKAQSLRGAKRRAQFLLRLHKVVVSLVLGGALDKDIDREVAKAKQEAKKKSPVIQ
jgi:hypothetical protein